MSVWPLSRLYTPTFPLCLNCFKVLNGKEKEKKEIWWTLSPHPLWRKCCRLADGIQRNKTGETDRATDGQEDVSQIESMSQTDVQTDRQSLLGETDRQAAGRRHWLFTRLHKQLQLWT